ncbi:MULTISPECIES: I78 family peptidase inhibitor [Lysobacteraceae]
MAPSTRIACVAFTVFALSACTSTPHGDDAVASSGTMAPAPAADAGTAAPATPAQQCNADAAQSAVGQVASDAVVEKARTDAGATVARTLKPNQAVTMEYRFDRLNLRVDAKNVVESVACG